MSADHGVLATVSPERGVDVVPVVFVVDGDLIVIPIDTVKAKSTMRLQRLLNIAADARVAILAEHYSENWDELWWVRATGRASEAEPTPHLAAAFAAKYPAYRSDDAIASLIVVTVELVSGWSAT